MLGIGLDYDHRQFCCGEWKPIEIVCMADVMECANTKIAYWQQQ